MSRRKTVAVAALWLVALVVVAYLAWPRGSSSSGSQAEVGAGTAADPWEAEGAARGTGFGFPRRLDRLTGALGVKTRPAGPPVVVTGVVRAAVGGAPVAGAEVAFFRESGEVTSTADGVGRYQITVASGVEWKVHARSDQGAGYPEVFVPAPPSSAPQERDLEIHALTTIRGRVIDARGAPAADVDVNVEVDAGSRALLEAAIAMSDKTDSGGRFEVVALPGAVRVRATRGMAQGVTAVPAGAPGTVAEVEIRMSEPIVVRGRVLDGTTPAAGATVVALATLAEGGVNERRKVQTNPDGTFELVMPAGYVRLEARGNGRAAPTWLEELKSGAQRDGVELVLVDEVMVGGTVKTSAGEPVVGARVSLIAASSHVGQTDDSGAFAIAVPEKRVYYVKIVHDHGRLEQYVESWDQPVALVLPRYGAIRIEVAGTTADARLRIDQFVPPPNAALHDAAETSFRGTGVIEAGSIEPGVYDLTVTASGMTPVSLKGVTVTEGATATAKVTLVRGG